jgi:hypothetical protein
MNIQTYPNIAFPKSTCEPSREPVPRYIVAVILIMNIIMNIIIIITIIVIIIIIIRRHYTYNFTFAIVTLTSAHILMPSISPFPSPWSQSSHQHHRMDASSQDV